MLFRAFIPFAFTALLCGMVLAARFSGTDAGLPAFYSFLPMSFYFLGAALYESCKRVRELEERIKRLETKGNITPCPSNSLTNI